MGNENDKGISKLPEVLICDKILSRLSTKDSVRTSVLCANWRNIWQLVPALDLDSRTFSNLNAFVNFGDRFLDPSRESWITKLKLRIHDSNGDTKSHLSSWIEAVTKRKIQQLEVRFDKDSVEFNNVIPMSVYTCETLVQLELDLVILGNVEVVSLPCLKILLLSNVHSLSTETTAEKLISGCPVLEDLTILGSLSRTENVVHVRSQTLKRIHIYLFTKFVIDAPLLQYLKTYITDGKKIFKIVSSRLPVKVDFHVSSSMFDETLVSEILADTSKARDLAICPYISKGIFLYLKSRPLLQLRCLSRLDAKYCISDMELLPILLESCPNLEYLKLELVQDPKEKETKVMFSTVPQCLISSLKVVVLKRPGDSISEYEGEMELVRYLLQNSRILEKLTLLYFTKEARSAILAMPRCSSACQIS